FYVGVLSQSSAYAIQDSDVWTEIIFTGAVGSPAATIAQAGTGGLFVSGWRCRVRNAIVGALPFVPIPPTGSTINGLSSLVLLSGPYADSYSDGANYFAVIGETPTGINLLRNSKFDIWRRGNTGTVTAGAAAYGPDGWIIGGTGAAITW